MLEQFLTFAFIGQTIRITLPYLFPSLGGVFSEKGGVINIALEGILLVSAFFTVAGVFFTNSLLIGLLFGVFSGMFVALIHSIVTIKYKANQIVSGIAINMLAFGLTKSFCKIFFNSSSNSARIEGLNVSLPANPFVIGGLILIGLSYFVIYKTKFGLQLRSVGENPEAADSLGIKVNMTRMYGVIISGFLASLGGVWLAFDQHSFTDGMTAGRGFIALAAMIIGKWNPIGAAGACLLFGFAESLTITLQGVGIPTQFIQMMPYVLTIIVLAGFIGRAIPPAEDGIPFEKN